MVGGGGGGGFVPIITQRTGLKDWSQSQQLYSTGWLSKGFMHVRNFHPKSAHILIRNF